MGAEPADVAAASEVVALVIDGDVLTVVDDGHRLPTTAEWPGLDEVASACGLERVVPLAPSSRLAAHGVTVHVVGGVGPSTLPSISWVPLDELAAVGVEGALVDVVHAAVAALDGSAPWPARRPPWFRPAWRSEAADWIDGRLAALDVERAGVTTVEQLWCLSAILRTPVRRRGDEVDLWFKASCEHFQAEASITAAIGSFADDVPAALAHDASRGWLLMEAIPAADQSEIDGFAASVARAIARIQLCSLDRLGDLRAAGCPDRTAAATSSAFADVLRSSVELDRLPAADRALLPAMGSWIDGVVADVYDCGLPVTLVHGDLHLRNVAGSGAHPVIYDWSDASISHPFLDGVHVARSAGDEHADAVRSAFVAPWQAAFPSADVERAWELATVVDRAFQAITYERLTAGIADESRWPFEGMVAGALSELVVRFSAAR